MSVLCLDSTNEASVYGFSMAALRDFSTPAYGVSAKSGRTTSDDSIVMFAQVTWLNASYNRRFAIR